MEGFSYELDPELDAELEAARRRHAGEPAQPFAAITAAAITAPAAPVAATPEAQTDPEAIRARLDASLDASLTMWSEQRGLCGALPSNRDTLAELVDDYEGKMSLFTDLTRRLTQLGQQSADYKTLDGENVGATMACIAIPWFTFNFYRATLPRWLSTAREYRGQASTDQFDLLGRDWERVLANTAAVYRRPNADGPLSIQGYTGRRMRNDSPWGIMLVQDSRRGGIAGLKNTSLARYHHSTNGDYEPQNQYGIGLASKPGVLFPLEAIGILEWIAYSLHKTQEDLMHDRTVLPANWVGDSMGGAWCDLDGIFHIDHLPGAAMLGGINNLRLASLGDEVDLTA